MIFKRVEVLRPNGKSVKTFIYLLVQALREIATQVGKNDWNFTVDPCSNESSWATPHSNLRPLYNNSLICNCSNHSGVCHVIHLFLKGQDLYGVLPPSLVKLPYLKTIDFTRNYLSGTIPPELASTKLEYIIFSANNLTGELPVALTNLTKLIELRISSNNFIGKIPDVFQSWKQLQKLEIQASGLEGPIPSSISVLSNLTELRISDLLGNGSEFPPLNNMTGMNSLDLSFNKLEENVPDLSGLSSLLYIKQCSYIFHLILEQYSLDINCGGIATTIGNIEFEEDQDPAGVAKFVTVGNSWGLSSSGNFWDVDSNSNQYVATDVSILRMNNSELYTSAWVSPLSLTYYARCLANGNYTVKLYFAEILFRDNRSFYSLGRRIFDVYIQEQLVLKDFNIENAAQGVDKAKVMECKAIVRNKVLQIRFHWAGKGTTAAPQRGTYGPLISAISVEADFSPPGNSKMKILIGVGAGVLVGYMAPEYALWGYLTHKAGVYSFGVVALEIVAGKNNMKYRLNENYVCLLDWALVLQQRGNLMELVDPKLGSEFNKEEAVRLIKVALLCTNPSPALRPNMSAVESMLKGQTAVHELGTDPSIYGDELTIRALKDQFGQILHQPMSSNEAESLIQSSDATWGGSSSISTRDLYSTNLNYR
ncbi:putative leucine-rich repeat receptor-like serine/threonine-protein kinase [Quercus suber]|uniref:non-specific serine/threonine protein kinase n=1 Tax=Quercus suber TaxID=58331 RepID=A0AAW0M530_QUESU